MGGVGNDELSGVRCKGFGDHGIVRKKPPGQANPGLVVKGLAVLGLARGVSCIAGMQSWSRGSIGSSNFRTISWHLCNQHQRIGFALDSFMLLPDVSSDSFVVSKIVSKLATCCDASRAAILPEWLATQHCLFFLFFSFLFCQRKRKCGIRVGLNKKDIRSLFVQVPIKQIKGVAKAGK